MRVIRTKVKLSYHCCSVQTLHMSFDEHQLHSNCLHHWTLAERKLNRFITTDRESCKTDRGWPNKQTDSDNEAWMIHDEWPDEDMNVWTHPWWITEGGLPGELGWWGCSRRSRRSSLDVISSHDSSGADPHENKCENNRGHSTHNHPWSWN